MSKLRQSASTTASSPSPPMRHAPRVWALRGMAHTSVAPAADQMSRITRSAWAVSRRSFGPLVKLITGLGKPRASSSSDRVIRLSSDGRHSPRLLIPATCSNRSMCRTSASPHSPPPRASWVA